MSSDDESTSTVGKGVDKGKGRAQTADPSERTPLLASQSNTSDDDVQLETTSNSRRRLWYRLTVVFLVLLSLCIIAFIIVAFLAYSYASRASLLSPDELFDRAVVLKGPDRLDVINVTDDGGIWLEIEGRIGVDAGTAIGVNTDQDDGFFRDLWKSLGRWGIGRLHTVTVDLSTIRLTPEGEVQTTLASIDSPSITLPLTTNPPVDLSWLTTVTVPLFITPTQNTSELIGFVRNSWQDGMVSIQAQVDEAVVRGGSPDDDSWRHKVEQKKSNILTAIHMKVPQLPGLPSPGRDAPFPAISDLITLESFGVISQPDTLSLYARASIVDPAPPSFNLSLPAFPFTIHLPDGRNTSAPSLPIASVHTQPFSLTHPNITLLIAGTVLPIPATSTPILSGLLTHYLSGEPSPIIITTPYLPSYTIDAFFPAPKPKPKVLRNVTIHNMKMVPKGTTFYASGTVYARAVLPPGLKVTLDVNRVLPDVLVFDGEVPEPAPEPTESLWWPWGPHSDKGKGRGKDEDEVDPAPPLPDPIPERAFARIRPDQWLLSRSELDPEESDEGAVYTVTAEIVDAPLHVLPGRENDMSNFVRKVIFGTNGAVAGILGNAAVSVDVQGLPNGSGDAGELQLSGLPFQGSVVVGKKRI